MMGTLSATIAAGRIAGSCVLDFHIKRDTTPLEFLDHPLPGSLRTVQTRVLMQIDRAD